MSQDLPEFDILLQLAESDPEQLEKIRHHLASHTINSAPNYLRPKLRGLQFRIDAARQLSKTPLAACIQISEMMYASFEDLRLALNGVIDDTAISNDNLPSADILPFRRDQNASSRHTS